ncbi:MAG: helix-turn-helix transcriptional regulator [Succiniclasticum sp.]|uniref:helix-turn-helix domain-containing protein n=1 Tax=Succiniclasticum sp. TaxID=2775030 RepID=UPI002A90BBB1|nr:helix-turn-helix transcriptional regulator [Succiniclasticum sp.]MDY6290047.1 helix-turn-helix transcriptional regulator [Succiniclasticum sp.]
MMFHTDVELYDEIGSNIKFYRKQAGLTQQELADKAQISISYLSKLEATGCKKSISISMLNNIANSLEIELVKFLERRMRL